MRQQVEIPGVGVFLLEVGETLNDYHHYVHELSSVRASVVARSVEVVIYPERDSISASYADRIRRIVNKVASEHRQMIAQAAPKIRVLMDQYGLDLPENFSAFVDEQRLTHIKVGERFAEVIYGPCSFFPSFDLNATLDDSGAIVDVWFDG